MTIIQQVAQRQGQIVSGVYQSASHRIVPVSDCLIENTVADEIIVTIRSLLKSFKIRPYDEDTGRGTLRHVLVRRGWRSGEILVVLVTAHGMPPGTIGIFASRNAARVIGVENNRDAVRDAISNAKANRADNVRFYTADASDFLQGMAKAGEHADVVILDPPRAGSDERFLSAVTTVAPERVVYVSCNPETLARDLGYLTRHGYRVERIQPVDMFPHTEHIETVALLNKLSE